MTTGKHRYKQKRILWLRPAPDDVVDGHRRDQGVAEKLLGGMNTGLLLLREAFISLREPLKE